MKSFLRAVLLGLALLGMSSVQAVEIAGAKIDETIQTDATNVSLKLNGAGIRYKFGVIKVYVCALYLPETQHTTAAVLAQAGPKKVNLTMLRDLSSDRLAQAFMDGVKRNTNMTDRAKLTNQFLKFGELFSTVPELKKGDVISIEWVPNKGSDMYINGKQLGDTFPDMAFFDAILNIWLGDNPVDSSLKDKMLGAKK